MLEQKYLLGCKRGMESQVEFHLSWVCSFSVMLSSLQNWKKNMIDTGCDLALLSNCVYHPVDCNPFPKCSPITTLNPATIQPSSLNHDRK